MEIQKQPTASIEYFLEAIAKAKNLLNLTQKTNLAKKRLAKITKEIAELLYKNNVSADFYHAGLSNDVRSRKQEKWKSTNVRGWRS